MKLSKLGKKLQAAGIEINFEALAEDTPPGDLFDFTEDVNWISEQLDSGNEAAWFMAKVSLTFEGLESDAEYLGGCSYSDFNEFTGQDRDYFDDMLTAALTNLQGKAQSLAARIPQLLAV